MTGFKQTATHQVKITWQCRQKAYVAEMGEQTLTDQGRTDARLRVIFDNGTESNMLMRSLQRLILVVEVPVEADGDKCRHIDRAPY
nr:hypothetical protein [Pseudogemmobacter faecipullorum]